MASLMGIEKSKGECNWDQSLGLFMPLKKKMNFSQKTDAKIQQY